MGTKPKGGKGGQSLRGERVHVCVFTCIGGCSLSHWRTEPKDGQKSLWEERLRPFK